MIPTLKLHTIIALIKVRLEITTFNGTAQIGSYFRARVFSFIHKGPTGVEAGFYSRKIGRTFDS